MKSFQKGRFMVKQDKWHDQIYSFMFCSGIFLTKQINPEVSERQP